jgi:hypothetical protein
MFSPKYQNTLTPTQFDTFMCNKPSGQQVAMLALRDGNVFVIADDHLPGSLIHHCSGVPLTVVPDNYSCEQFTTFLDDSAEFYRWAYYLDEEEFQRRALESILQRNSAVALPLGICIRQVQAQRLTKQAA